MKVGDIVDLHVTRNEGYAYWGTAEGKTGFSHCIDWSDRTAGKTISPPVVGQIIKARVFHLTVPGQKPSEDVTFGGEIHVDFACSFALVDDNAWKCWVERRSVPKP